jgi:hypothetical protein
MDQEVARGKFGRAIRSAVAALFLAQIMLIGTTTRVVGMTGEQLLQNCFAAEGCENSSGR